MSPISTSDDAEIGWGAQRGESRRVIAIREETPGDEPAIAEVTTLAFAGMQHSDGSEPRIIECLRAGGNLTLSLVAEKNGQIVGHAAFSPITIDARHDGWFGLGPVSVLPESQGEGVGSALIRRGLDRLREAGAMGCVVLGDPVFYRRFGFAHDAQLRYEGPPAKYFQRLIFTGAPPRGAVAYAPAFGG